MALINSRIWPVLQAWCYLMMSEMILCSSSQPV